MINLQISAWYEKESEKIKIMSRSDDINHSEKVRIFHHDQHFHFRKISSILKLMTPQGEVEGHEACASALEANVADHLLNPALLDPQAQYILLSEVEQCFTDDNNVTMKAPPTKSEIKKVLDSCRAHADPRTDGLTVFFYQKCWQVMGYPLAEMIGAVFMGEKPSACQRTSLMVFGNKPGKKAKSLLISDRRKLSLLNVNFKLMTGVEAAHIQATMNRTISPLQLVTGGDKLISHRVAMARDTIHAAGLSYEKCGILDTDLIAAFCNMVCTWCLMVMARKGLAQEVIDRC